jgi:hypothetical protein
MVDCVEFVTLCFDIRTSSYMLEGLIVLVCWNGFVGGGAAPVAAAAPAGGAAAAAAPAVEEKKEEAKEESDDDMGFSLFDWGDPLTQPLANFTCAVKDYLVLCYVSRLLLQLPKFWVFEMWLWHELKPSYEGETCF